MIYVGVDIAKHTHYACVTDEGQKILSAPFPFENDEKGFSKLVHRLQDTQKMTLSSDLKPHRFTVKILSHTLLC